MNRLHLVSMFCLMLAACGGEGPLMRPGENCLACHDGSDREAPKFTAAGTVFANSTAAATEGLGDVTVIITDANGTETRLTTNAAGNFYTSKTLTAPFTAAVERNGKLSVMNSAQSGSCASCHANPPVGGAPGRIYAPAP